MVALGLLACIIPLLVNLLPSSLVSLKRAERLQVATTLASYRMDEVSLLQKNSEIYLNEKVELPPYRYQVTREFYAVDAYRLDIMVTVHLLESNLPPIRFASRMESKGSQ